MSVQSEGSEKTVISLTKSLPMVEVDCSSWESDIPEEQWSSGDFVSLSQARPMIEVDAFAWDCETELRWLDVLVAFEENTKPAVVWQRTVDIIRAIHVAAPEWGLAYDSAHSRADNGDVVNALMPENRKVDPGGLDSLAEALRSVVVDRVLIRRLRWAA